VRTSDRSERLVGHARAVPLSGADHRRILRVQLAFRLGGLLVLAAMSPLIGALRIDCAAVRVTLFIVVYISAEALLRKKTGRIVAELRKNEDDLVGPSSVHVRSGPAHSVFGERLP
jgi:hypothetical protein